MPAVSVIIPTHNRADMLAEALLSVHAQTYTDFEVIVVDDGSMDHTRSVIDHYCGRIILIRQEKQGRSRARNAGISAASGDYLAFLDDDDVWLPRKLELQMKVFAEDKTAVLVYGSALWVGGPYPVINDAPPSGTFDAVERLLGCDYVGNPSVVVVRRSAVESVGFFDPLVEPCEDWDLWLRLAVRGYPFRHVGVPIAEYRMHEGNTAHDIDRMHVAHHAALLKFFRDPKTPKVFIAKRNRYLSMAFIRAARQYYAALKLAKARKAWSSAMWHDPVALVNRTDPLLAVKSLCGAGVLRWMRGFRHGPLRGRTPLPESQRENTGH